MRQHETTNDADPPSLELRRADTKTVEWLFRKAFRGRRRRVVLMPRRWHPGRGFTRERRWQKSPVTGERTK
jgi:hypothetical protein